jgi:hypothetical protein
VQQPKSYASFVIGAIAGLFVGAIAFALVAIVIVSVSGAAGKAAAIPIASVAFILMQILGVVTAWKFGMRGVRTASGGDGFLLGLGIAALGAASVCDLFIWGMRNE